MTSRASSSGNILASLSGTISKFEMVDPKSFTPLERTTFGKKIEVSFLGFLEILLETNLADLMWRLHKEEARQ